MNRDNIQNKLMETAKRIVNGDEKGVTQITTMINSVQEIIPKDTSPILHAEYHNCVLEIVNEWYRSGILYFGKPSDSNAGYPWMTFTKFGKDCISNDYFLPYDPEGYLKELLALVPNLDLLTQSYLQESVSTYNSEHLLSSAITLGVASENIFLQLIESFENSINNPQAKASFSKLISGKHIYSKYSHFIIELKKYEKTLPDNLKADLETQLNGVFNFIRMTRNKAGHPTGQIPSKKIVGSNLQIFAEYSKRVIDLKDFFDKNTI